jgi:glycosyltransferase involved in cell wall biosynthesis
LLRWWADHPPGFDVELVVARPGALTEAYRSVAPTRVARFDHGSPERVVERVLVRMGLPRVGRRLFAEATRRRIGSSARPTVTVVNGATAATARLLDLARVDGPVLLLAHELSTGWFHNIDEQDRSRLEDADAFLAVARCVERLLVERLDVAPELVTVVPPMVEVAAGGGGDREDRSGPTRTVTVGGGGTTDWRKAPELWLQVAYEVVRLAPDLPLRFVWFGGLAPGDDAFWPLEHEIAHLDLGPRTRFLGEIADPTAVLRTCDVFVSTAREDAYPLVCAEAAANGVPVVAFEGGGAAELIADGGCGVAVPYPDLTAMAAEVVAILRDDVRRDQLGRCGRKFASDHLDVSVVAPQVTDWISGRVPA